MNTGPLCELVRVNYENIGSPLTVKTNFNLTLPLHISLEFVSNDFRGTGPLFTLGDPTKGIVIELALDYGRPVLALNSERKVSNLGSLHNNQWHRLDLFFNRTPNGVDAVVVVDRCIHKRRCSQRVAFTGLTSAITVLGPLKLGSTSFTVHRLKELCLENIVVNSELVDLWEGTESSPLARGCPKCEEACFIGEGTDGAGRCGAEGVCRNPIVAATDQYACTCRPGFQQPIEEAFFADYTITPSAPCTQPATEWQVNGPVSVGAFDFDGITLQLSIRTRQTEAHVLRSDDGLIRLDIEQGHLIFHADAVSLTLPAVFVSDGLWHAIQLTITPLIQGSQSRMIELSVDGLWNTFYNATLVTAQVNNISNAKHFLLLEADSSCLSDIRMELRDGRNNIYHDYLINELNQNRHSTLVKGCQSENYCESKNPCGLNEVCMPEWRGYKCVCKTGFSYRAIPPFGDQQCVLSSCEPNPCQHDAQCSVLSNGTVSWGNETIGVLCECTGGWSGLFCENPMLVRSGFLNWWLLPLFFVLILIIFWVVFCVCWWRRRKLKKGGPAFKKGSRFVEPLETISTDGVAKAGEEDYRGSLNLSVLKVAEEPLRPHHLTVRNASVEETRTSDSMTEAERFLAMDQPLQYAFEGYDSSPPPTYFAPNIYDFSRHT
ncbi:unnamed protein product [Mesocestoides corti]|nr:unnamed protein product [Mesocestoides corti]